MRHLVHRLAPWFLLAACEIQPAPPKQQQPTPPPAPAVAAPAAPALPPPAAGSGSAGKKLEVTPACVDLGSHVAGVFISSATDPGQKSVYEQERTKMVRATAEACTTQQWPPEALACYHASKTPAELKACEQRFVPTPTARPSPPQALPPGVAPAEMRPLDTRHVREGDPAKGGLRGER